MRSILAAILLLPLLAFAQKPDILEVVEIDGVIGAGVAEVIAKRVDEINDNNKVKAVLLVLNTPGGSVTASSAIYEDLARLKVPVVIWCQALCASGGVYVAMSPSVKFIGVRSETIGGSVGVVATMVKVNRLLDWAKIDAKTFRSGHLKDTGNPLRGFEEAEVKYYQSIIDSLALRFYDIVGKARGKKIADWADVKTARIFIGQEIVKAGLADAVVTKAEVTAKAKELSGSKTIFTREELKKMSAAAEGGNHYSAPVMPGEMSALARSVTKVLDAAVSAWDDAKGGGAIEFAYLMPERL